MKLYYILKETIDGFKRSRISSTLTIMTIAFFLVIIGTFGYISYNINKLSNLIKAQIHIEAFISNILDDQDISNLSNRIKNIEGIESVEFLSKQAAAKEFQKEFGNELFDLLEENPLPASFQIKIKKNYRTEAGLKKIAGSVEEVHGIDEVVYRHTSLSLISRYARIATIINILILFFVTLGSLFIVSNTIRLVILSRRHIIETMKLVGATSTFVKTPLILEGIIQGTLGGIIAGIVLFTALEIISAQVIGLSSITFENLFVLAAIGFLFGYVGSLLAIKKFL